MHVFPNKRLSRFFVGASIAAALASLVSAQTDQKKETDPAALRATGVRSTPRRAVIEGLTQPAHELRITDLAGRDISAEVEPRTESGKVSLNLAQSSPIVIKPKAIPTMTVPLRGRVTLPGGAIIPLSGSEAVGEKNQATWFRLTFGASPVPASWDDKTSSYLTELTFGLQRPAGAPANLSLGQPVIVKLGFQGLVATETTLISIEAAGLENEKTVPLHFIPQSAKPTVLVRSSISEVNLELSALPRLVLQPERSWILGLGLDEAIVAITRVEPDGRNSPVAQDTPVAVTVEGRARIDSTPLMMKAGAATTRLTLRSSGLGSITIRATADGVGGATTLRQTFPALPLGAACIGGALGGFARRYVKGARRKTSGRRVVEGVVVSAVLFVAGVLGVGYLNLPQSIVGTEAGAFLTGALAGFLGVTAFELIAKKNSSPAT